MVILFLKLKDNGVKIKLLTDIRLTMIFWVFTTQVHTILNIW